jgi:hypothetical protein
VVLARLPRDTAYFPEKAVATLEGGEDRAVTEAAALASEPGNWLLALPHRLSVL